MKCKEIMKAKNFIKQEFKGGTKAEYIWLTFCTMVVLAISLYCKDSIISILGAFTGIWCTIFTGKGKRSAFIFGVFNVFLYSYISYKAQYYGEVMLNMLYFMPMNIIGWFAWAKHLDKNTYVVIKNTLAPKKKIFVYCITAIGIFIYGIILKSIGGNLPYIDSMSTIISITAQALSIKRFAEQWILWIIVDAVTVIMWALNFADGGENIAMLIMWSIYLINGIMMFIKWQK